MKIFIHCTLIIILSTCLSQYSYTQTTKWGLASNAGVAINSGNDLNYGFDLQADFRIISFLSLTSSAGFETYTFQRSGSKYIYGFLPLLAGVKYYISDSGFFLHAQFGYSLKAIEDGGTVISAGSFGFSLSKNFEVSLKYYGYHINGGIYKDAIGCRAAFNF